MKLTKKQKAQIGDVIESQDKQSILNTLDLNITNDKGWNEYIENYNEMGSLSRLIIDACMNDYDLEYAINQLQKINTIIKGH